jgi:hypothetical protein
MLSPRRKKGYLYPPFQKWPLQDFRPDYPALGQNICQNIRPPRITRPWTKYPPQISTPPSDWRRAKSLAIFVEFQRGADYPALDEIFGQIIRPPIWVTLS